MQHLRNSYAKATLIYHSQAGFQCLWNICAHGGVYQSFGGVARMSRNGMGPHSHLVILLIDLSG